MSVGEEQSVKVSCRTMSDRGSSDHTVRGTSDNQTASLWSDVRSEQVFQHVLLRVRRLRERRLAIRSFVVGVVAVLVVELLLGRAGVDVMPARRRRPMQVDAVAIATAH
jgi:hypothetical protein